MSAAELVLDIEKLRSHQGEKVIALQKPGPLPANSRARRFCSLKRSSFAVISSFVSFRDTTEFHAMSNEDISTKTEEDFNQVMDAIDKEMREENIPIPARQIKGWLKFSSRFGLRLKMGDPLSRKVMDWFNTRYGEKVKVDFAQGEIAVSIRGDLYKMYFPFFAGRIQIICDPRFWTSKHGVQIAKDANNPLPVVNVLNCIEELTENYALTLSRDEQGELFRLFQFGNEAFQQKNLLREWNSLIRQKGTSKLPSHT